MLPGWDRLQDLRGGKGVATEAKPDAITQAVADRTESLIAERVVRKKVGAHAMSLLGKLAHLTADAEQFTDETGKVLDGISEKIALARARRDIAKDKHHGLLRRYHQGRRRIRDRDRSVVKRPFARRWAMING